jgi:hypothetical protein
MLNGDQPIPVRHPPCHDDDKICPKVRPGHSDLNKQASEVFWHWWYCNKIDQHPQEIEARRFRRMLDALQLDIEKSHEDARTRELTEALKRVRRT